MTKRSIGVAAVLVAAGAAIAQIRPYGGTGGPPPGSVIDQQPLPAARQYELASGKIMVLDQRNAMPTWASHEGLFRMDRVTGAIEAYIVVIQPSGQSIGEWIPATKFQAVGPR